ncbi:hypothetical protein BH23BAC1_BH23BAC1_20260 [soil metagenome]
MLTRIVRMSFKPENVNAFLALFDQTKDRIRNFHGCLHLELFKDYHQNNVYFTYSHWENDRALEIYRKSDLFREVWQKTKILFSEKPAAFSMIKVDNQQNTAI